MWIIDDDIEYNDIDDVLNHVFDKEWYKENYDSYELDDWINETYYDQRVEIGGETFYPAEIVRECNSDLYDDLLDDWADSRAESDMDYYGSEIENMSNGDVEYYNNYKIEFVENTDEEEDEDEDEVDEFNAVLGATSSVTVTVRTISEKAPVAVQVIS